MKRWTQAEKAYITEHYANTLTADIAKALNRSEKSIYGFAFNNKLLKSRAFVKERCREQMKHNGRAKMWQFRKNHEAWNKGLPVTIIGSKATQFKKGQKPHNTKADGVITLRRDKASGKYYQYIRIAESKWKPLHVHMWEQVNGRVPNKTLIVFKDKNTMNCTIENLEAITQAENARRNSIMRYPREVRELLHLNSKLKRKIRKYEKQN